MKAPSTKSKKSAPRGLLIPIKHGKPVWPKRRKPPSPEAIRKREADDLIAALVDAAHTIGMRGIVEDYSKSDFHLYPRHIVSLFAKDHPKHSVYAAMDEESRAKFEQESSARLVVPWPRREGLESKTTNELREKPFEIIGLLMRKVLDADSAFFEAMAEAVRAAKIDAKKAAQAKDSPTHSKGRTRAGMIVAGKPSYGMGGHPDWFTRIAKPLRKGKAPYAIWSFCKKRYDMRQPPPTRREISGHLEAEDIACRNLRAQLARMNLDWLPEGGRSRKT